jgi:tRNA threonylcarbamoyladenosine biosynthesis protein TsaB
LLPNPTILTFDTSAAHCAAVLLKDGAIHGATITAMQKGQAEQLFPILETVLAAGQSDWKSLTALAVCTGPGNFTGIRISVAAARGLALSLGIPAIGVSRLQGIARDTTGPTTAVIDARQNRFYTQAFLNGTPAGDINLIDLADLIVPNILTDAPLASPNAPPATVIAPQTILANLAHHAATLLHSAQPRPAPLYVRAPDAALPADPPPVILP